MLEIKADNLMVFEVPPGFRYEVTFGMGQNESYVVEGDDNTKHNLEFNPKSQFAPNNFYEYLVNEKMIIESMRVYSAQQFTLTFVVVNQHILSGTKWDQLYKDGIYCIGLKNGDRTFTGYEFEQFCSKNDIPMVPKLYDAIKPSNVNELRNLFGHSKLSRSGDCYSILVKDRDSDHVEEIVSDTDKSAKDKVNIEESEQAIREFVGTYAKPEFINENLVKRGHSLKNVTRIYNAIIKIIKLQEDYPYYHETVVVRNDQTEEWFEERLKKEVKGQFKHILDQFKKV